MMKCKPKEKLNYCRITYNIRTFVISLERMIVCNSLRDDLKLWYSKIKLEDLILRKPIMILVLISLNQKMNQIMQKIKLLNQIELKLQKNQQKDLQESISEDNKNKQYHLCRNYQFQSNKKFKKHIICLEIRENSNC
ncbi:unnamed protein product [Paramecium pentaurelia]|uniref:Uncharacterized protein n=1 Tax=Paramecium pentaurelia TaxID=43138 RepID=A0A8S1VEI1_9CILI|nr:unnamed protein product [Paramecium pentaurelia]